MAFTLVLTLGSANAATIYVSTTGTDVGGCGTAPASACASIQFAYDSEAISNDEIRVLPGTYNECIEAWGFPLYPASPPSLSDKPVQIVADAFETSGNNTATTIDGSGICDGIGNTALPTVTIGGTGAEFRGFTVTGGGRSGVFSQGGVAITDNLITGNASITGGGIYAFAGSCYYAGDPVAVIADNEVTLNTVVAPTTGAIGSGDGGGIYVSAESNEQNLTPPIGELPCLFRGDPDITISGNTVTQNTVANTNVDPIDGVTPLSSFGAGIYVLTNSATTGISQVTISGNSVSNNNVLTGTQGFGGGIWASTFGFGTETIEILDNTVDSNSATADGGGISAWLTQESFGVHSLLVDGNTVTNNQSDGNGGGLDLLSFARDVGVGQSHIYTASNNDVTGNFAGAFGDGGGIAVEYETQRTTDDPALSHPNPADSIAFSVTGNNIQNNTAGLGGGGMIVSATANGDPDSEAPSCGIPLPASIDIEISSNLVLNNQADGNSGVVPPIDVIGAGILTLPTAVHVSRVTVDVDNNTVAGNNLDFGFVGGIEVQASTPDDACIGGNLGNVEFNLDSNVVADNSGVGVGGPPPGANQLAVTVTNNSVTGHPDQNYEAACTNPPCLFAADPPPGSITADPLLDPVTYFPNVCSPVFDAGAGFFLSPDVNADDAIDGLDILAIAVSNGSSTGQPRFNVNTDLNRNGMTDGDDLANMASQFGDICP